MDDSQLSSEASPQTAKKLRALDEEIASDENVDVLLEVMASVRPRGYEEIEYLRDLFGPFWRPFRALMILSERMLGRVR